ncbi:glycosyltransferase family 4 protein [Nesterenkonia salmonea]|uniref:Glycosyltransferase family 4 protein n=1 Tax=Nesterenkonia salmonea TaxID=1804987 RepID=A0A5R9BAS5_9MICC|nr:glycosyltransferase family 1 protein [Nesterenkonia salmonea]TLP97053.1 glycosyltransferase family 4 protein [Nesterenkonia salmonea]
MSRLILATTASDTPMGAERYQREISAAAPASMPGWKVSEVVARSMRSPLSGNRRLPMNWLQNASLGQRKMLGKLIYGSKDAIVHRMDLLLPPGPGPDMATIHDTVAWRFNDEASPIKAAVEEAQRADAVICVSEFSANEVQELLGVRNPVVVYNGVDGRFFNPPPLEDQERERLGLDRPYVLHFGGASERKNLKALAEAWPVIHQSRPDLLLALSGPPHPRRTSLFSGLPGVRLLGSQPEALMPSLVGSAAAVVVPSTYEGFGLPALEGMAAGVPVVAAETSALPEIVGDAGLLVQPTAEGITEGVLDAVAEGSDVHQLRQRAMSRAADFTWQRCIDGHSRVWKALR